MPQTARAPLSPVAQATLRLFVWTAVAIPPISIAIHFAFGSMGLYGWNGNLLLLVCALIVASLWRYLATLGQAREYLVTALLTVLLAWAVLRTGISDMTSPILSWTGLLILAAMLSALAAGYSALRAGMALDRLLVLAVALSSLSLLALPVIVTVAPDLYTPREWTINLPGFTHVRAVGSHASLALAVLVAFGCARPARSPLLDPTGLAVLGLCAGLWCVLFWSGSRAGPVTLLPALILTWGLIARPDLRALAAHALAAAAGAAASLLAWAPNHTFDMFARTEKTIDVVREAGGAGETAGAIADKATSSRVELWQWSLETALEKPLAGWGYLPMRALDGARDVPRAAHAHNSLLDYVMGFGLPAGLALGATLLVLWGVVAVGLSRRRPDSAVTPCDAALFTGVTLCGAYTLHSAMFISPWPSIFFGLALGGLLGRLAGRQHAPDARRDPEAPPGADELFAG